MSSTKKLSEGARCHLRKLLERATAGGWILHVPGRAAAARSPRAIEALRALAGLGAAVVPAGTRMHVVWPLRPAIAIVRGSRRRRRQDR